MQSCDASWPNLLRGNEYSQISVELLAREESNYVRACLCVLHQLRIKKISKLVGLIVILDLTTRLGWNSK